MLQRDAIKASRARRPDVLRLKVLELRGIQNIQQEAAIALLRLLQEGHLPEEDRWSILCEVAQANRGDVEVAQMLGDSFQAASDIDDLNSPPPDDADHMDIIASLSDLTNEYAGNAEEEPLLESLATAARMMGRQCDKTAENAYRRLIEIDPERSSNHYNLGLFYKTRGRFEEGLVANQTAASLSRKDVESTQWNLGICATGAGEGQIALDVWKRMKQNIEMGRFGLPEGGYPSCKVKLAERPLAERDAASDHPGNEETVWIERLSPCHGIIRSVLYRNLGIDYGDVVLIDGAPITYHKYGDVEIPVFPHLATLSRQGYRIYDFAGVQSERGQLADLSRELDDDTIIYSHSESFRELCSCCWRDDTLNHADHDNVETNVVSGRIAASRDINAAQLLKSLDIAVEQAGNCRIYVPDLCADAGFEPRAAVEAGRLRLIAKNSGAIRKP